MKQVDEPEERLLRVGVECYEGHCGEQTPRTLILGDRRVSVAEVLDERSNTWELTMFALSRHL